MHLMLMFAGCCNFFQIFEVVVENNILVIHFFILKKLTTQVYINCNENQLTLKSRSESTNKSDVVKKVSK